MKRKDNYTFQIPVGFIGSPIVYHPPKKEEELKEMLNTIDIYDKYKHLFSDGLKNALSCKTTHMVHQYDELANFLAHIVSRLDIKIGNFTSMEYKRRMARVMSLAIRSKIEDEEKTVKKIVNKLESMYQDGAIKASLFTLGYINMIDDTRIVFSYPAVYHEVNEYKDEDIFVPEGGMPCSLEELDAIHKD